MLKNIASIVFPYKRRLCLRQFKLTLFLSRLTAMTQVVLNVNSKKEWDALKPILEVMNIEYITHDVK
jgi:hypothetical protein